MIDLHLLRFYYLWFHSSAVYYVEESVTEAEVMAILLKYDATKIKARRVSAIFAASGEEIDFNALRCFDDSTSETLSAFANGLA